MTFTHHVSSDDGQAVTQDGALEQVRILLRRELNLTDTDLAEDVQLDLLPGADSVRLMRVISELERSFAVELDDQAIRAAETVGDFAALVLSAIRKP